MATPKQFRRRGRWAIILGVLFAFVAITAVAWADGIQVDGDTLNHSFSLKYNLTGTGTDRLCSTRGSDVTGDGTISYNGNSHFAAGESVSVTVAGDADAVAQGITGSGTATTVPDPWSHGDSFPISFTTNVPATAADGTYTMTVTVAGAAYSAQDTYTVGVACPSPTPVANAGNPYTGTEGSAISLDGTGSTPGAGATITNYHWAVDLTGADASTACNFSANDNATTAATPTVTCNDDSGDVAGGFPLSLTVTDSNSNTDTDGTTLTVSNANPVVADPTITSQSNCSVSISAGFTDAGTNDTHTATIDWGVASHNADTGTVTETAGTGTGTVTGSFTYGGPGTYSVYVTVNDDDAGSGTSPDALTVDNNPTVAYPLAPINVAGKTFNTGSAIPIKISVSGCTTGLAPTISIDPSTNTVGSKGKSNDNQSMRYDSSIPGFIYNWNTKSWPIGLYKITVNGLPGGPYAAPVTLVK